jgi:thioredoxin-dependent peroxiredoxin
MALKKSSAKSKQVTKAKATAKAKPKAEAQSKAAPVAKAASKLVAKSQGLNVGDKVPQFSLPSTAGGELSSTAWIGKKVVLYFYPKDSTSGCTLEGQQFTALNAKFNKLNTIVFGVSRDSIKSHEKFREKYDFNFHLISDPEELLCNLFGVIKEKNMYGKKVLGIERSTFLIDESGVVVAAWRGVKADGHASQVFETVKGK